MKCIPALFFSLIVLNCDAQYCTIRGIIKDSIGNPLQYVTIEQADKRGIGTTTRADGSFLIHVQEGKTIESSYIGYSGFQYKVKWDAILEIVMPAEPLRYNASQGYHRPESKRGRVLFEIESHSYIIPPGQIIDFLPKEGKIEEDYDWVFAKVEVMPVPQGGMSALCKRLGLNVKGAKKRGGIRLKFFVGPSGYISNIEVLRSYRKKVDQQIVSNFKKAMWKPAMQNGRNIGVWCIFDLAVSNYKGKTILQ